MVHHGKENGMYGKTHTDEAKKKISESRTGTKWNDDVKQRISDSIKGENHPMYGKKHRKETIDKMSEVKHGINNPMYGVGCSVKCIDGDKNEVTFPTISEASETLGISITAIRNSIEKKKPVTKGKFKGYKFNTNENL